MQAEDRPAAGLCGECGAAGQPEEKDAPRRGDVRRRTV